MVSKTRDKLIEVARQLFVNKGVENTTMNDIASASDKGRRTIYTYFKNKREIYNAVVESQSNIVVGRLKEIAESDLEPGEKLCRYLKCRFSLLEEISSRPKSHHELYRTFFNRDARRAGRIYNMARKKETAVFNSLLQEGIDKGAFDRQQAENLPDLMTCVFSGIENIICHPQQTDDDNPAPATDKIIDFVIKGILKTTLTTK